VIIGIIEKYMVGDDLYPQDFINIERAIVSMINRGMWDKTKRHRF
jgi:hypothetical protein